MGLDTWMITKKEEKQEEEKGAGRKRGSCGKQVIKLIFNDMYTNHIK